MPQTDLALALQPVIEFFNRNNISYFVGGSVASSHHGAARSTLDVDLSAQFPESLIPELATQLGKLYYLDTETIRRAIHHKSCFNLVHLETSFKVDVFVVGNEPFLLSSLQRAVRVQFGSDPSFETRIASVEDILLIKLAWYRLGEEMSERQWRDVTSVAKLNAANLDHEYLRLWAARQNLDNLLDRLLSETQR